MLKSILIIFLKWFIVCEMEECKQSNQGFKDEFFVDVHCGFIDNAFQIFFTSIFDLIWNMIKYYVQPSMLLDIKPVHLYNNDKISPMS